MHDVKCESIIVCIPHVNGAYSALVDDRRIRVSASENDRIFNTKNSAKLQTL